MLRLFITISFVATTMFCYGDEPIKASIGRIHHKIDQYIIDAIEDKYFPGAQLIIGSKEDVIYSQNYGFHDYSKAQKVTSDDIYDIASCTKVLSATVAVMCLIDDGKLTLSVKIKDILPEYKNEELGSVTLSNLLKHTSGLLSGVSIVKYLIEPANDAPLYLSKPSALHKHKIASRLYLNSELKYNEKYISTIDKEGYYPIGDSLFIASSFQNKVDSLVIAAYRPANRGKYRYSDLNFYFISKIIERVSDDKLNNVSDDFFADLDIYEIGFNPLEWKNINNIIPTEYDCQLRQDTVRGFVHDEFAASLGGVTGNAGLFSNAQSMAKICQLFLNNGEYNDQKIISPETLNEFTSEQFSGNRHRGYGFDKQSPSLTPYSEESYGHSGFTGTYFWVDPKNDIYVVLLTNRVNPSRLSSKMGGDYRKGLWELITSF